MGGVEEKRVERATPRKSMNYNDLITRLESTNDMEAAEAIINLVKENKSLREGYEAMFRDLQKEVAKRLDDEAERRNRG